jgi:hypothetical protein
MALSFHFARNSSKTIVIVSLKSDADFRAPWYTRSRMSPVTSNPVAGLALSINSFTCPMLCKTNP